jgi:hypothetical protein
MATTDNPENIAENPEQLVGNPSPRRLHINRSCIHLRKRQPRETGQLQTYIPIKLDLEAPGYKTHIKLEKSCGKRNPKYTIRISQRP